MTRRVMVIGCGVIGLTTGLILLREGHEVTLLTKDTPPNTTSNAAGAFWYPVLDEPASSLRNELALATYDYIRTHVLHKHADAACVERMIDTYYNLELASPHESAARGIPSFKVIDPKDVPPQINCIGGFSFQSFVVDTDNAEEVFCSGTTYDGVVNCTGLGAEKIFGDTTVFPVRGQTILVAPIPGYDRVLYIDSDDPTYVIPRKTDCVLGGTYQVGNYNVAPDLDDTKNIMQKVSHFGVTDVHIKKVKVGLRPGRPTLKLESEDIVSLKEPSVCIPLIHNYGHGGRGFTLSWGCALRVTKLLEEQWK